MRRLLSLTLLLPLAVAAQPSDPCGLAGTYELDRQPIHDDVVASMDESLATLGDRPADGTIAAIEWTAKRQAFQRVRAEAEAGDIVPRMTIELRADGTFRHRVRSQDRDRDDDQGRWSVDRACRTLTIDVEDDTDEPTTGRVEGDRITLQSLGDRMNGGDRGLSFDRIGGSSRGR